MAMRKPKARSLSVFLLKREIFPPENALVNEGDLLAFPVAASNVLTAVLRIKPTYDRLPSWLSMFDGALNGTPSDIHNASSAAVLLIESAGRNFALTFGYGKSLLRPGSWEEDFGLRVTLNAVDPLKIRSVDRVKFDAITQHSQIQASRDANILEFGFLIAARSAPRSDRKAQRSVACKPTDGKGRIEGRRSDQPRRYP